MPYLTQLADVARRTGYPVTEVPGWKTRGHGEQPAVQGIVCHHTAGWDDMHVVRDGRPDLDGPLSQFWLRRDGRIFVVAAGRCWHNAPSTSPFHTNSASLGIEAENDGQAPWPAVQLDAYRRLCAELCRAFDLPASRVRAHREVNTAKPDPHSIDMNRFRADVARLIEGGDDVSWTDKIPKGPNWPDEWEAGTHQRFQSAQARDANTKLDKALAALAQLAAKIGAPIDVDEAAIVRGVLAGLSPAAIAAAVAEALPADLARQVVAELATRLEA